MTTANPVAPRFFQPGDVARLEEPHTPHLSSDGDAACFVERFDPERDEWGGSTTVIGAEVPAMTTEGQVQAWLPDGRLLLADDSADGTRLRVTPQKHAEGTPADLTSVHGRLVDLAVSPNGRLIAGTVLTPTEQRTIGVLPSEPAPERHPFVATHPVIRNSRSELLPRTVQELLLVDAVSGQQTRIAAPLGGYAEPTEDGEGFSASWFPDSSRLVVSLANGWDADSCLPSRARDLYGYSVPDGTWRRITNQDRVLHRPRVAPDGSAIAFLRQRAPSDSVVFLFEVCVLELATGAVRCISVEHDLAFNSLEWCADVPELFVGYLDRGHRRIARLDLDGQLVLVSDDVSGMVRSPAGDLTCVWSTPGRPPTPCTVRRDGHREVVGEQNQWLVDRALAVTREIEFPSSHPDRRSIHAIVASPPDAQDTSALPVVVDLHGGPYNARGLWFDSDRELFVGQGYVVVQPNYRGSLGYGQAFARLSDRRHYPGWYDDPSQPHEMSGDVIGVIDAIREQGLGDPERVFLRGVSAGALLTTWVIGRTDRFRAAVANSWYTGEWGAPMYGWYQLRRYHDGPPWDPAHMPSYWRRSPIMLAGQVRTPLLLVHGDRDYFTPLADAEKYYGALRGRGLDTVLAVFPGEEHGVDSHPDAHRDSRLLEIGWFRKHDPTVGNTR